MSCDTMVSPHSAPGTSCGPGEFFTSDVQMRLSDPAPDATRANQGKSGQQLCAGLGRGSGLRAGEEFLDLPRLPHRPGIGDDTKILVVGGCVIAARLLHPERRTRGRSGRVKELPDSGMDITILAGRLQRELQREPCSLLIKLRGTWRGAVARIAEVRSEGNRRQIGIPLLSGVYFVGEVHTE